MDVLLLVEDAVEWARAVARALRENFTRVQILTVASNSMARRYLSRTDIGIRCVIQDIFLLDGISLNLIKDFKDSSIPTVIVTGHHSEDLLHRVVNLGADFYFVKPVALSTLVETVKQVFARVEPGVIDRPESLFDLFEYANSQKMRFTPKEEALLQMLIKFKSVGRSTLKSSLGLSDGNLRVLQHRINIKLARLGVNWRLRADYGKSVRILELKSKNEPD